MPNSFFRFQQFVVYQDRCAMKVGTDSVLLGAWAKGGRRILDVGAGTGVIALMMAQRFPQAEVMAVDIDGEACAQAVENVVASPFSGRVDVRCVAVQQLAADEAMQARFDAIVSNPPFFDNALKAKGESRLIARHTDTLPFAQLFAAVRRLLAPGGVFSAIIPFDYRSKFESEASLAGFFTSGVCALRTTPSKAVRRYLLSFQVERPEEVMMEEQILEIHHGVRSEWYASLTQDFYL